MLSLKRISDTEILDNFHLVAVAVSACIFCLLGSTYIYLLPPHKKSWMRQYLMPPGPHGSPIVGSLVSWFQARNRGTILSWLVNQAQHGDMTTLSMGSKTWVFLNTPEALNEILSKRASFTSERPYLPITGGLVSRDRSHFLLPTSDLHDGPRLIHRLLLRPTGGISSTSPSDESSTMTPIDEIIHSASLQLLKSYLDNPKKWYEHNYRYATAIIYEMVTGAELNKSTTELDEFQHVASTFLVSINSHYVDFFPQLAMLVPVRLQFWRAKWVAMGQWHYDVMRRWWAGIISSCKDSSFVQDVLASEYANAAKLSSTHLPSAPDSEERAMYLVMFLLAAGADNPRMTLNGFIMACISHPEAIHRAREELDKLCGYSSNTTAASSGPDKKPNSGMRLPTLTDLPNLPYISAIVKEVLRWRPTVPLMPQRIATRDLIIPYNGKVYKFPKGTEFLVNTIAVYTAWGYTSPEKFNPERWLNPNESPKVRGGGGRYNGIDQDSWQFAFSAGKRSCSGYRLAQRELFLAMARLLFCFDFQAPTGDKIDDTVLNAFYLGEPFPVEVKVRSASHERLIRDM